MARPRGTPVPDWPQGPQPIDTGTAEIIRDPGDPTAATLHVNGVPSSHIDLTDPGRLDFEYMQQMAVVIDLLAQGPVHAVHLGGGGCALARYVHHSRPGSRQLAVELDARLAELARAWFGLPRAPALRIRVGDARAELEALTPRRADLIIRDVFAEDRTPDHLRTVETSLAARRALRPGGTYLVNCADRPPLREVRAEAATLAEVFGWVGLMAEPAQLRGRRYGNVVLIGSDAPPAPEALVVRRLRTLPVPASLVSGARLADLVAGMRPLRDPAPDPAAGPAPGDG